MPVPSQLGPSQPSRRFGSSEIGRTHADESITQPELAQGFATDGLVDDVRGFKDQHPALVARSSSEALRLLDELESERIDHRWLDHDLVGTDTVDPVVDRLVHRARMGSPQNIGPLHIHTANIGAGYRTGVMLKAAGYPAVRSYAFTMWTRWF